MSHIGRYGTHFKRVTLFNFKVESVYEVLDPDEDLEVNIQMKFGFTLLKYLKDSE